MKVKVRGVYVGEPQSFGDKPGFQSGFIKTSVCGPVKVTPEELESDRVQNIKVHGGPDRIIHHYPAENFQYWKKAYPDFSEGFLPGSFAENISTLGVVESDVCIGDIFSLGSSKVQITEGRKPCGLIDIRYGVPGMFKEVQKQKRMGWFYRVLEAGEFQVGSELELQQRPYKFARLDDVSDLIMNKISSPSLLEQLKTVDALSERWKQKLAKLK